MNYNLFPSISICLNSFLPHTCLVFILNANRLHSLFACDIYREMQESADNVNPDSNSPSKDALLEEACRKYDEATCLCPTLHDVCFYMMFVMFSPLSLLCYVLLMCLHKMKIMMCDYFIIVFAIYLDSICTVILLQGTL